MPCVGRVCGIRHFCLVGGMQIVTSSGEGIWHQLHSKKTTVPSDSAIPLLGVNLVITSAHCCAVCHSKRLETARVSSIQGYQLLMLAHLIRWNKKEVALKS